jgi:hypothetical protein
LGLAIIKKPRKRVWKEVNRGKPIAILFYTLKEIISKSFIKETNEGNGKLKIRLKNQTETVSF